MDREAAQQLNRETGIRPSGGFPKRRNASKAQNVYNQFNRQEHIPSGRGQTSGSASRFFYCPKAGRRERNHGLVSNNENGRSEAAPAVNDHETVKPIEPMRWLVRLTTAPGATVLDPFTGSGSTGVACMLEGRSFIGIEQIPKYAEIAKRRIRRAAEDAAAASKCDGR